MTKDISRSPDGTEYPLPTPEEDAMEKEALDEITRRQRELGRRIVAVQGLGFVGAVMAVIVADAENGEGEPIYFVHGHQRPSQRSFWKVRTINEGTPPVKAEDPEIPEIFSRAFEKKTLRATWHDYVYELADIVVVDIQLDATKPALGKAAEAYCDLTAFSKGMRTLGQHIRPETLVLVETTVPPGTCEKVIKPILTEEFEKRGIDTSKDPPRIAHSYERVMPGKKYVRSIRNFWRTFAGVDEVSADMAEAFLTEVLDVENFPLYRLGSTTASEMAKVLENTYRAVNIALLLEWARLAEETGVNLFEVIKSIRVRKGTHDNMCRPSLGVGGYCLTKDPVLANWAAKALLETDLSLEYAVRSVDVNDLMPLHTFEIISNALDGDLKGKKVALLGASYLEDVGDTRHSPSATLLEKLTEAEAKARVHDPLVGTWLEMKDVTVQKELTPCLEGADVVVFAVGHKAYLDLEPEDVVKSTGGTPLVVDCSNFLTDEKIMRYLGLGCRVRGIGKGHIEGLKPA
jgi:UDP-N-acetyl-D-glucosamine dehydrogenase